MRTCEPFRGLAQVFCREFLVEMLALLTQIHNGIHDITARCPIRHYAASKVAVNVNELPARGQPEDVFAICRGLRIAQVLQDSNLIQRLPFQPPGVSEVAAFQLLYGNLLTSCLHSSVVNVAKMASAS